ncbi:unnamed protein product, partial [Phaeothamnion confervicola]
CGGPQARLEHVVDELKRDRFLGDSDWPMVWRYAPVMTSRVYWHRIRAGTVVLAPSERAELSTAATSPAAGAVAGNGDAWTDLGDDAGAGCRWCGLLLRRGLWGFGGGGRRWWQRRRVGGHGGGGDWDDRGGAEGGEDGLRYLPPRLRKPWRSYHRRFRTSGDGGRAVYPEDLEALIEANTSYDCDDDHRAALDSTIHMPARGSISAALARSAAANANAGNAGGGAAVGGMASSSSLSGLGGAAGAAGGMMGHGGGIGSGIFHGGGNNGDGNGSHGGSLLRNMWSEDGAGVVTTAAASPAIGDGVGGRDNRARGYTVGGHEAGGGATRHFASMTPGTAISHTSTAGASAVSAPATGGGGGLGGLDGGHGAPSPEYDDLDDNRGYGGGDGGLGPPMLYRGWSGARIPASQLRADSHHASVPPVKARLNAEEAWREAESAKRNVQATQARLRGLDDALASAEAAAAAAAADRRSPPATATVAAAATAAAIAATVGAGGGSEGGALRAAAGAGVGSGAASPEDGQDDRGGGAGAGVRWRSTSGFYGGVGGNGLGAAAAKGGPAAAARAQAMAEARVRFLMAVKSNYTNNARQGWLNDACLRLLQDNADYQLDVPGQPLAEWARLRRRLALPPWQLALASRLRSHPLFGDVAGAWIFGRLAAVFELASNFIAAHEDVDIGALLPAGEAADSLARENLRQLDEASATLGQQLPAFPEVARSLKTQVSARFLLARHRQTVLELSSDGFLTDVEAEVLLRANADSRRRLDRHPYAEHLPPRTVMLAKVPFLRALGAESMVRIVNDDRFCAEEFHGSNVALLRQGESVVVTGPNKGSAGWFYIVRGSVHMASVPDLRSATAVVRAGEVNDHGAVSGHDGSPGGGGGSFGGYGGGGGETVGEPEANVEYLGTVGGAGRRRERTLYAGCVFGMTDQVLGRRCGASYTTASFAHLFFFSRDAFAEECKTDAELNRALWRTVGASVLRQFYGFSGLHLAELQKLIFSAEFVDLFVPGVGSDTTQLAVNVEAIRARKRSRSIAAAAAAASAGSLPGRALLAAGGGNGRNLVSNLANNSNLTSGGNLQALGGFMASGGNLVHMASNSGFTSGLGSGNLTGLGSSGYFLGGYGGSATSLSGATAATGHDGVGGGDWGGVAVGNSSSSSSALAALGQRPFSGDPAFGGVACGGGDGTGDDGAIRIRKMDREALTKTLSKMGLYQEAVADANAGAADAAAGSAVA